jgi:hypothetical protein
LPCEKSRLRVNLGAFGHELFCFLFQADLKRLLFEFFAGHKFADVFCDLHRAEKWNVLGAGVHYLHSACSLAMAIPFRA